MGAPGAGSPLDVVPGASIPNADEPDRYVHEW
jgi:hypothetical protein